MFPGRSQALLWKVGSPAPRGSERGRQTLAPGRPRGSFGHLLPVSLWHIGGRWCAVSHECSLRLKAVGHLDHLF